MYFHQFTLVATATRPRAWFHRQVSAIALVGQAHSWSLHSQSHNKHNLRRTPTSYPQNLFLGLDVDLLIECPLTYLKMAYPANDLPQSMCIFFTYFTPLFVFQSIHISEWLYSQLLSFRHISSNIHI